MHQQAFEVSQFLSYEAQLLDEGRFEDWLALYDEDAWYWMPVLRSARVRGLAPAHIDEDRPQIQARIARLRQPTAFSEHPPTRMCRLIGNVQLQEQQPNGVLRVSSRLLASEYRNRVTGPDHSRHYAAEVHHWLRPAADRFRIAGKRLDLVDAESGFYACTVPL